MIRALKQTSNSFGFSAQTDGLGLIGFMHRNATT